MSKLQWKLAIKEDLRERVRQTAEAENRTVTAVVARALAAYCERSEQAEQK